MHPDVAARSRFDAVTAQLGISTTYNAADAHRMFQRLFRDCPESDVASLFGVTGPTVRRWLSGDAAVPVAAFRIAQWLYEGLPPVCGDFAGWRFSVNRGRWVLTPPGVDERYGCDASELRRLPEYRQTHLDYQRLSSLVTGQAELIERLQAQNAWLRRQVRLEAKLGMMLMRLDSDS